MEEEGAAVEAGEGEAVEAEVVVGQGRREVAVEEEEAVGDGERIQRTKWLNWLRISSRRGAERKEILY